MLIRLINRYVLLFVTVLIVSGCATPSPSIISSDRPIVLPSSIYQKCDNLDFLPEFASFEILLESYIVTISKYADCKNKQDYSIQVIKNLVGKDKSN